MWRVFSFLERFITCRASGKIAWIVNTLNNVRTTMHFHEIWYWGVLQKFVNI